MPLMNIITFADRVNITKLLKLHQQLLWNYGSVTFCMEVRLKPYCSVEHTGGNSTDKTVFLASTINHFLLLKINSQ